MKLGLVIIYDDTVQNLFEIVNGTISRNKVAASVSAVNLGSLDFDRDVDYIDAAIRQARYIVLVLGRNHGETSPVTNIIAPIIRHARTVREKVVVCVSVGRPDFGEGVDILDATVSLDSSIPNDTDVTLIERILSESLVEVEAADRVSSDADKYISPSQNEELLVAHFGLTIVDSIVEAAIRFAKEPTRSLLSVSSRKSFSWDEGVLQALNSGFLDVAIYNQSEFEHSKELYPQVHLLRNMGSSMGGLNFFVLSQESSLARMPPPDWLLSMSGKTIVLPIRSDISTSFQMLVGCSLHDMENAGAEVVDVSQFGDVEDILAAQPILLLGGQNLRFSRRVQSIGYKEVANLSTFPRTLRPSIRKTARNGLFISDNRLRLIGLEAAHSMAEDIWRAFRYAINDESRRNLLIESLLEGETQSSYRPILELIIRRGYGV